MGSCEGGMLFLHHSSAEKMFATRKEAELLHWHEEGRKKLNYKKDGKFRHPVDAVQWGNINTHFPWFDDARTYSLL
jgi:hypothetical protein